ncbi:MAG: hypothetical protein PVI33_01445 [Candidatus Omnitrophota bacterium]|jgi:hypothetical protein
MRTRRAQSINEYSVCLAVIVFAVIAMRTYIQRGLQARYRDLVVRTTAQASPSSNQYEPYYRSEVNQVQHEKDIEVDIFGRGRQTTSFESWQGLGEDMLRFGTSNQGINCYDD